MYLLTQILLSATHRYSLRLKCKHTNTSLNYTQRQPAVEVYTHRYFSQLHTDTACG
jgi:hypothetical protein